MDSVGIFPVTEFKKKAPDISVGIATRYGLDGPGIEPRWR